MTKQSMTMGLGVVFALAAIPWHHAPAAKTGKEPVIRVLVLSTAGSATVATAGHFRVLSGGVVLFESDLGGTVSIYRDGDKIVVRHDASGQSASDTREILFEPDSSPVSILAPSMVRAFS